MAIIRSKIARQLLAEGGSPRKRFFRGGEGSYGDETEGFDFGQEAPASSPSSSTGFEGSPEMGGRGTADTYGFDQRGPASDGDDNFIIQTLKNIGTGVGDRVRAFESFINPNRDAINRARRRDFLVREGIIRSGPLGDEDLTVQGFTGDLASKAGLDFARGKGYTTVEDMINKEEGGDNMPMIKLRAPIAEKKEPELTDFQQMLARAGARFEDGGDVRQEYGLGSIVKKATRAVKKVVKSPVGKAALLGGLAYFGPSFLAGTKFGFAGTQGPLALQRSMKAARLGRAFGEFAGGLNPLTTILGTSAIAGLASKEDEEEEKLPETVRSDPEMRAVLDYYGQRFAQGGDVDEEPEKMASMPSTFGELNQLSIDLFGRPYDQLNDSEQEILIEYFTKGKKQGIERATAAMGGMMEKDEMLDLGGKEMDLRGGGFVPLGEYEKKDDVPARLSKNEFVFTADAVRAAGGGSVDKGADVMYKTMKTLENKVA